MIGDALAWLFFAPIALATTILLIEIGLGLLPPRRFPATFHGTVAVIMPAHDEAAIIAAAVAPLVAAGWRLLVVADNCSDSTAANARAAGAEVVERRDAARRGKGFAVALARDHLAADPPDVAIVIDADCQAEAGSIAALAAKALQSGRPAQAAYLMRPRRDLGAMVALSGFAFLIRNLVRQRGLARIGAPAILTGSGMAFPWPIFAAAPLATADPVEDLALGIALSRAGHPPVFCGEAVVWTTPAGRSATLEQRSRWERGFIATALRQAPSMIASGRPGLVWLGLHQLVPPLALLAAAHLLLLAVLLGLPAQPAVRLAEGGLLAATAAMLGLAWALHGRSWLHWTSLLAVPAYMLWKLPIYAASLLRRDRPWNRTRRL